MSQPVDPAAWGDLHRRAMAATDASITISDLRLPDQPLIVVNEAFTRTTGFAAAEVLGRNCRFLQGPDTDPDKVAEVREAIRAGRSVLVTLLNYRKDGTPFWNQLALSPIYDDTGELAHYVGVQTDVSARQSADDGREQALIEARRARDAADVARQDSDGAHAEADRARAASVLATTRLIQLANVTSALTASLDIDETLARLTEVVVPALADWCVVNLVEADGSMRLALGRHRDPVRSVDLTTYLRLQPGSMQAANPIRAVASGGRAMLIPQALAGQVADRHSSPDLVAAARRLGVGSAVIVPLQARRRVHGALSLINTPGSPPFTQADLEMFTEVGRRAGLAIDNARLYAREHEAALALQRSLLPTLPEVPGLSLYAEYHASTQSSEVGGDWYDVLALPDDTVGLVIGDVMGHDLAAAAAMGQLRSVLRSYAWDGDPPGRVLERLDRLVKGLGMPQFATCLYLRLDREEGGGGQLTFANAGHPAALLIDAGGGVRRLEGALSPMIGVPGDFAREQATVRVEVGTTLVLFTDGLVEDRDSDIDDNVAALATIAASLSVADVATLCRALLAPRLRRGVTDDIAVLVVRLT